MTISKRNNLIRDLNNLERDGSKTIKFCGGSYKIIKAGRFTKLGDKFGLDGEFLVEGQGCCSSSKDWIKFAGAVVSWVEDQMTEDCEEEKTGEKNDKTRETN